MHHIHAHMHKHQYELTYTLPDIKLPQMSWKLQLGKWASIEQQRKNKQNIGKPKMHDTQATKSVSFYTSGKTINKCLFEKKIVGLKMLKTWIWLLIKKAEFAASQDWKHLCGTVYYLVYVLQSLFSAFCGLTLRWEVMLVKDRVRTQGLLTVHRIFQKNTSLLCTVNATRIKNSLKKSCFV